MTTLKKASLILEDGTKFEGFSFGATKSCSGEVVFNTGMTGYPESLTDPSYLGQILVSTFPLIGNYGVPSRKEELDGMSEYLESEKIHPQAIVCQDYSTEYSHWQSVSSLSDWLIEENVVGICGIDTRALTKILRDKGSMLGKIIVDGCSNIDFYDPNKENLVGKASCKEVIEYGIGNTKNVVLVDCGVKNNIIRCLLRRGAHVIRVPWDYDFTTIDYDGLFIS
ncbi:MAG: carbamoyl-phosphate synthase domain-containing protein, partial [Sodaliphilus sp.]|nr:carbamoyl-phosphate synthase domain-containing protein [Sodaliphilus sp.]